VGALSAVHAVKPVHAPDRTVPYVELHTVYQATEPVVEEQHHRDVSEDRRTYCRRVSHLPVLEELRSGIDRRHHNIIAGDVVEHIDVTV
jgi:hypothetical protein